MLGNHGDGDDDDGENQKVVHRHWPHNNGSLGEFSLTSSGEADGAGMDRCHDDDDGDDSLSCGGGQKLLLCLDDNNDNDDG